ncbi:hypothetical protein HYU11_00600 [Candidatus Woesearchaeota archaeon]|nr:hypothetical protein [Candidatus Woesearchaeota archaeon]
MNPVYIKVDRYKKIGGVIERIKVSLDEAKVVIARLDELKVEEEKELQQWKAELEKISSKVAYIEDSLAGKTNEG